MAAIGLKKIKYAKYAETNGSPVYSGGRTMGESITADINIETTNDMLYAEDGISENDREFVGGTLGIGVKELDYQTQKDLYGHTYTAKGETTPETLKANKDDSGAYVGVGFAVPIKRAGVKKYRAFHFKKLAFGEPTEAFKTKEKTITYATPTTPGTIMTDNNGDWKEEAILDTLEAAEDWIDTKLNIS